MLTSVIGPFGADVCVAIVWIPMLPDDSLAEATEAGEIFGVGLTQFFDPERRLGAAIALALGASTTAWDIYLTFDGAQRWNEGLAPPAPAAYAHQLGNWADASRFRTGEGLVSELRTMAQTIIGYQK